MGGGEPKLSLSNIATVICIHHFNFFFFAGLTGWHVFVGIVFPLAFSKAISLQLWPSFPKKRPQHVAEFDCVIWHNRHSTWITASIFCLIIDFIFVVCVNFFSEYSLFQLYVTKSSSVELFLSTLCWCRNQHSKSPFLKFQRRRVKRWKYSEQCSILLQPCSFWLCPECTYLLYKSKCEILKHILNRVESPIVKHEVRIIQANYHTLACSWKLVTLLQNL